MNESDLGKGREARTNDNTLSTEHVGVGPLKQSQVENESWYNDDNFLRKIRVWWANRSFRWVCPEGYEKRDVSLTMSPKPSSFESFSSVFTLLIQPKVASLVISKFFPAAPGAPGFISHTQKEGWDGDPFWQAFILSGLVWDTCSPLNWFHCEHLVAPLLTPRAEPACPDPRGFPS